MEEISETLKSLIKIGFEYRGEIHGAETVGFKFPNFDLTVSDCTSKYFTPIALVWGILNTGRTIANIESEIPQNLETPEAAAAWVSYILHQIRDDLEPIPEWILMGERNWDLIPTVKRLREYELRPHCSIEREHAKLLRKSIKETLSQLTKTEIATFSFDGQILSIKILEGRICALATGIAWNSSYQIEVSKETKIPSRFSHPHVDISYFEDKIKFGNYVYRATEINT